MEYRPLWLGLRRGAFAGVKWQVTLCDPIMLHCTGLVNVAVVLKDAWARIEAHGRELRGMGAHGAAWVRTAANGTYTQWQERASKRDAVIEQE